MKMLRAFKLVSCLERWTTALTPALSPMERVSETTIPKNSRDAVALTVSVSFVSRRVR